METMIEKMDRENQRNEKIDDKRSKKIDDKRSKKIDDKRRLTAPDFPEVAASYVRETIHLVKSIETRFLELGARLYKIRTDELWPDSYGSYYQLCAGWVIVIFTKSSVYFIFSEQVNKNKLGAFTATTFHCRHH